MGGGHRHIHPIKTKSWGGGNCHLPPAPAPLHMTSCGCSPVVTLPVLYIYIYIYIICAIQTKLVVERKLALIERKQSHQFRHNSIIRHWLALCQGQRSCRAKNRITQSKDLCKLQPLCQGKGARSQRAKNRTEPFPGIIGRGILNLVGLALTVTELFNKV